MLPSFQRRTGATVRAQSRTARLASDAARTCLPAPAIPAASAGYTTTTTVITYTYDALNRLTGAEYSDGTSFEYQYDKVGNPVSATLRGTNGREAMTTTEGTTTYAYDEANRLTSVGGVSYTYDDNGNLTNDGAYTYTYTWSVAGRLIKVEDITTTIVYTYASSALTAGNGDGVRVAQSVDGQLTEWVMDPIGLAQVLVEISDGSTTVYAYGLGRLAQVEDGAYEWFLGDALGSVRQVVDDNGGVVLAEAKVQSGKYETGTHPFVATKALPGPWRRFAIWLRSVSCSTRLAGVFSRLL